MKILHLSDPHFGVYPYVDGNPSRLPLDVGLRTKAVMQSTHQFVTNGLDNSTVPRTDHLVSIVTKDPLCQELDLIVVSGDLAWSGSAEDFTYARAFLDGLRANWPNTPIVLTPGNHDVDRTPSLNGSARQDAFIQFARDFYGRSYAEMFPWMDRSDGERGLPRRDRIVSVLSIPKQMVVVSVNSAARIMGFEEPSPIHIREGVLEYVQEQLKAAPYNENVFRLFVVHHHLLPFSEMAREFENKDNPPEQPDDSIILNSAKLQGWLAKNHFGVVLHGHKHVGHGRVDTLWRKGTPAGRKLVIIGAGSCGVRNRHREMGELLTYNVLDIQQEAREAWQVSVVVRSISDQDLTHDPVPWFEYVTVAGVPKEPAVHVFQGSNMAECHARLAVATKGRGRIHNFISVVEGDLSYRHPPTVRKRGSEESASEEDVWDSFLSLHPEYDRAARFQEHGWHDPGAIEDAVGSAAARDRYVIDHGTRIFGRAKKDGRPQPISSAIDRLASSRRNRAYLGLYDPNLDACGDDTHPPLPGLVGIQFVADDRDLDIVATFRGLELSFWWAVNMLEAGLLLKYAARQKPGGDTYDIRRITLMAAVAEWKANDPEPIFVSQIDESPDNRVFMAAFDAVHGKPNPLRKWLGQKRDNTNIHNIDATGLERLLQGFQLASEMQARHEDLGRSLTDTRLLQIVDRTRGAVEAMKAAIEPPPETRAARVDTALSKLGALIELFN